MVENILRPRPGRMARLEVAYKPCWAGSWEAAWKHMCGSDKRSMGPGAVVSSTVDPRGKGIASTWRCAWVWLP